MKGTKGEVKDHWLDYADDIYDKEVIFDAKSLLFIMWVFIPLPVFWAFYAMYSRWEQQARSMKNVGDEFLYIARQLQTDNLIFPILMVPLFEYIIYPLFSKLDLLETRLQRMAAGGMLSAIAFTLSGIVYLKMEAQPLPYGITITENTIFRQVMLINNSPCFLSVYKPNRHSVRDFRVDFFKVPIGENKRWIIEPKHCSANKTVSVSVDTGVATAELVLLLVTLSDDELIAQVDNEKINTKDKRIRIKICFSTDYDFANHKNASFLLQGDSYYTHISPSNATEPSKYGVTAFKLIKPGKYDLYMPHNENEYEGKPIGSVELEKEGIYIVGIYQNSLRNVTKVTYFSIDTILSLPLLYQYPQILVLSAGNVMLFITGQEFSYSQAPQALKTFVQGIWFLLLSIGKILLISIQNKFVFEKHSNENFMCAAILFLCVIIFAILAYSYKYVEDR
ncbi:hypothetical protein CDAR_244701 [Caerostris darwini]|uniref:Uncharacterized protein n=1 Tax=Caerostris darwini TaxID=1538125 RepID=A0AAV4MNG9_9ARAC|nr:hypothetical protein CDAR_244701 [Caerostris darwini]